MTARPSPRWWSVAAAALLLHVLIALPPQPERLAWQSWTQPALEWLVLIGLALALGRGVAGIALRLAATLTVGLVTVLKLVDLGMRNSLDRSFNPVGDLPLIDASVRLVAGSVGVPAAIAAVLAAVGLVLAILAGLWWAMGVLSRAAPRHVALRAMAGGGAVALTMAAFAVSLPVLSTHSYAFAQGRVQMATRTLAELSVFRDQIRVDAMDALADPLGLIDRDVLIVFLESYGRTSFDTPFYSDLHLPTLRAGQARLQDAGLAMASGFLTSPTHGGQSWLAHATLANGLWINDQIRYQAGIASGRRTLFHRAADAGFRTAAIMPAIVRPWPEALTMGFQRILGAPDLGYRGQPFHWVTMPDQFTMQAVDRLLRDGSDPRRLFAQIALISSHAPWTPVPQMIPWDDIGDGTIFDAMAQAGDPPNVVWRDMDRVRAQYRDTIDYTLQTVLDYAERAAKNAPLIVLVGDHQAATLIGQDDRRQVPLHIIGPPGLLAHLDDWNLTPGLVPDPTSPVMPMETFRDRFLGSFSGGQAAGAALDGPDRDPPA